MIRTVEEHAFQSGPALETRHYDGWLLRSAKGRTRRTNSVNFLDEGSVNLAEKIAFCETYYEKRNQPCHFRITPLTFPENLDEVLENRGYGKFDPTDVCVCPLETRPAIRSTTEVKLEETLSAGWLEAFARLTNMTADEENIYSQTNELRTIGRYFASVTVGGQVVACGVATFANNMMGLFEFATDPDHRRKGYAEAIVEHLFQYAAKREVTVAYLQVVQDNQAGQKFWKAMGFNNVVYSYHYRSKFRKGE